MKTMSPRRALDLQLVREADQRWRDARRSLEPDIQRELNDRVRHLLEARNEAVLLAFEGGAPKTAIADVGLRTKSTSTARLALDAARERRRLMVPAVAGPFSPGSDAGVVHVRLDGVLLAEACRATGWTVEGALAAGVDQAEFRIVPTSDGSASVPVAGVPSFVESVGKAHPVVAWGRANSGDIIAWWNGRQP